MGAALAVGSSLIAVLMAGAASFYLIRIERHRDEAVELENARLRAEASSASGAKGSPTS